MKHNQGFIDLIVAGVIGAILVAGSIFSFIKVREPIVQAPVQTYGSFNPSGGQTYRLQSSISSTQSTVTLTSFKEPISGIKYTMAYLNSSIEYGTIDPQNNSSKEFVSFTGITQNSDGTALLTGVTRGLGFSYPYTASTTLASSHSGQSIFILSNPPQLTNQYAAKANNEWITGSWGFSVNATTTTNCATSSEYCNKAYVDAVAVAGASNADDSTKGIVETATRSEASIGATTGSTGARLALGANIASSSAGTAQNTVVITKSTGLIDENFIATTSVYNFTGNNSYAGTQTFSGLNTFSATSTNATTTQNGSIFGGNIVNSFIGFETISGASTPKPAMMATTTGRVAVIDSDVASTTASLLGFVINNCANGTTCYVQTDGVVGGFTGLTTGAEYYVSDTSGVLSTTIGTAENYVGRAFSTSQIEIDKKRAWQYLGTQALTCSNPGVTVVNQPWARFVVIESNATGAGTEANQVTISKTGAHTAIWIGQTDGTGGNVVGMQASWAGGGISMNYTNNSTSCTATAYYYR